MEEQWEYDRMEFKSTDASFIKKLNKLGAERWEVCGTIPGIADYATILLKRRLPKQVAW